MAGFRIKRLAAVNIVRSVATIPNAWIVSLTSSVAVSLKLWAGLQKISLHFCGIQTSRALGLHIGNIQKATNGQVLLFRLGLQPMNSPQRQVEIGPFTPQSLHIIQSSLEGFHGGRGIP